MRKLASLYFSLGQLSLDVSQSGFISVDVRFILNGIDERGGNEELSVPRLVKGFG